MFKFLRRYNKWILSVGGVLLMITFLIPQAITRLSQSAGVSTAEIATVGNGDRVTAAQWSTVQRELQLMDKLQVGLPGLGVVKDPAQWFLLVREAEQAGLVRRAALSQEQLNLYAAVAKEGDADFIQQTIGKIAGVAQMLEMYMNSAVYSDRRLKTFAEQLIDSVNAQFVALEASADKSDITPTEDEISAQMAKYADKLPGEGEMGFGYKLPDRVKLEWLTISADAVRKAVEASPELSQVNQYKHWIKNEKGTFGPTPPADQLAPQIPDDVRDDLLNTLTTQKLGEISQFAFDQLRLNRRGLVEREGFVETPADWPQRMTKLPDLAGNIQSQFGIDLPAYESSGEKWMTLEDAAKIEGLGGSTTDKFGARVVSLQQLLAAAKEFGGDGKLPIQKDIAGPPMKDGSGNVYFFRIIDTSPAHAPTSVDDVREQVVKDLKRLADYERLVAGADSLKQKAITDGMLALALDNDTIVQRSGEVSLCMRRLLESQLNNSQAQQRQQLFALPTALPVVGADEDTIKAIVDRALSLPTDKPLWEQPEDQRVMALPVKDKLTVLVARLMSQEPLSREMYLRLTDTGQLQQMLAQREIQEDDVPLRDVFGLEALSKRNNFVEKNPAKPDDGTPEPSSAANAG